MESSHAEIKTEVPYKYSFNTLTYSTVLKHMIGPDKVKRTTEYPYLGGIPVPDKTINEKRIEALMGSCLFKGCIACVGGAGFGVVFGLFTLGVESPSQTDPSKVPTVRETLKEMKTRMGSYAKNFAMIGVMFSMTECAIESYRGKHDMLNTPASGFITGTLIGLRGGLRAGLLSGCGFAAFSSAIDYYFLHR